MVLVKSATLRDKSPFETRELRLALKAYLQTPYQALEGDMFETIGSFKWGVYIFYDYDGEPIYVGQTNEKISGRIGRHLTNQRTDAVAMSVLDPFEVFEIEVYPLPQYQGVHSKHAKFKDAKAHLDALEFFVHQKAKSESRFKAILNEKDPPAPLSKCAVPKPLRGRVVSEDVLKLRGHPDTRTARRAQVISRLAQTIAEREVKAGLRRTLLTQATRLQWLAAQRFSALGGQGAVEIASEESEDKDEE
jgi:GIY-YIG catalytic domain